MSGKSRSKRKKRKAKPSGKPAISPVATPQVWVSEDGGKFSLALQGLACLPWLLLLGWLTSVTWFLCDDAFISFRYARNLVEGRGLVFNPGEYVEGYTNFLWLLEVAAIWRLFDIPPEQSARYLSVAYTLGTVAAMLWWVRRMPGLPHRGLVGWMALGLVCSSATFAVWSSGGGIETRQFTFFLVVALVALSVHGARRGGLLTASFCLAAAALTRPEGLLLGGLCLGGFAVCRMARERRLRLDWRELALMGGPFALVVAGHYLWRYGYYGEWLPNTYYAKYVSPWYESGLPYLAQAGVDTGLYLLLPLLLAAGIVRWMRCRDGTYAVVLLLIVVHMNYLARIGGDHFEYRPLDFYWPLLAVAAAEGIARLGGGIAIWARQVISARGFVHLAALVLFLPVLFYVNAIQGALLYEGAKMVGYARQMYSELNKGNAGRWLVAPGMSKLAAISNTLRQESTWALSPSPWAEHRAFARWRLQQWKPYENMARGTLPDDAVSTEGSLGVKSYYLPDLEIIDQGGLTDATVARNPTTRKPRALAHERQPPPGYLEQRGVNFHVRPAARSAADALRMARYALKIGPNLWMPFDSNNRQWVVERFADRELRSRPAR